MLPNLLCPKCSATLGDIPRVDYRPTSFQKCRRRCNLCGVGFSNARGNPVVIYENPENNVPRDVRNGLRNAFDNTFNIASQVSKEDAFCSEHSEDAITWTVFNFLMMHPTLPGHLPSKVARFGVGVDPEVLLWGLQ